MFSIIIPVYNTELYLKKCIDSVLNQSYQDYEIILINDGSTDNSGAICDEYKLKSNKIRVIHKNNEGLSQARNDGMQIAKGKYIIFLDSDDWINDGSLKKVVEVLESFNYPDIIINRISSYYEHSNLVIDCKYNFDIQKLNSMSNDRIFTHCYNMEGFWGAAWFFIVRRDYIEKNNLFFEKGLLHEDEDWSPIVIMRADTIGFNNNCFYCNRVDRLGSITQTVSIKKEYDKLTIIDRLIKESKKDIYDEYKKKVLLSRCSSLYMGVLAKLKLYKNDETLIYNSILNILKDKRNVLLYSNKVKHKLIYLLSYIIGLKNISIIVNKIGGKDVN